MCSKTCARRDNIINHIENIHYPGTYQCPHCAKVFNSQNTLYVHVGRNHKQKPADVQYYWLKFIKLTLSNEINWNLQFSFFKFYGVVNRIFIGTFFRQKTVGGIYRKGFWYRVRGCGSVQVYSMWKDKQQKRPCWKPPRKHSFSRSLFLWLQILWFNLFF